jgi:hypothetical protein
MQTEERGAGKHEDDAGLFSLLYVSEMASPDAAEVARICGQSRANNLRDGVTGLLVFDGKAFCQYVEGSREALSALRDRIERDPRHLHIRVVHFGRSRSGRRFPLWRLGYAFTADPAAIDRIVGDRGEAANDTFGGWLDGLAALDPQDR